MKQTKSELDDGQLDQYRLHKSSDQNQFKAIQKLINNKSLSSSLLWSQAGSSKELDIKMLKDPEKIYGKDDEHINLVFNKGFQKSSCGVYNCYTRL